MLIVPVRGELVLARQESVELERARWKPVPRQQVLVLPVLLSPVELELASLARARERAVAPELVLLAWVRERAAAPELAEKEQVLREQVLREQVDLEPELRKPELVSLARD